MNRSTNFNFSEEAFILSSLKEVVNGWARGHGQASFNLGIVDGFADLQLSFRLGSPADLHLLPEQVQPLPQEPPRGHSKRKKSPAKLAKDRARAANHQARIQSEAKAGSMSRSAEESLSNIILPITGKLIPVKSTISTQEAIPVSTLPYTAPSSRAAPDATLSPYLTYCSTPTKNTPY